METTDCPVVLLTMAITQWDQRMVGSTTIIPVTILSGLTSATATRASKALISVLTHHTCWWHGREQAGKLAFLIQAPMQMKLTSQCQAAIPSCALTGAKMGLCFHLEEIPIRF